jgi:hypothetical protein
MKNRSHFVLFKYNTWVIQKTGAKGYSYKYWRFVYLLTTGCVLKQHLCNSWFQLVATFAGRAWISWKGKNVDNKRVRVGL